MTPEEISSFEEFWPHYVRAHANKNNRRMHFVGTSAAMALVAYGLFRRKLWPFLAAPVAGYGLAWIGHFFVEGNVPATFGHPLWSLKGDFVMWKKIAEGTMDEEVERYTRNGATATGPQVSVVDTSVN